MKVADSPRPFQPHRSMARRLSVSSGIQRGSPDVAAGKTAGQNIASLSGTYIRVHDNRLGVETYARKVGFSTLVRERMSHQVRCRANRRLTHDTKNTRIQLWRVGEFMSTFLQKLDVNGLSANS